MRADAVAVVDSVQEWDSRVGTAVTVVPATECFDAFVFYDVASFLGMTNAFRG